MAATIAGRVVDNNLRPVGKVKISLKGKTVAESGKDGFFAVSLAKAESRIALTFAAEGYVSNTKVYDGKAKGGINTVVIWPVAYRVKFDPARELDIELGASRIRVPGNVLTGPGGEKLNGAAALRFTWFDVTSSFQRAAAPGDFSGQMLDRSIRRLNSYGIFDFAVNDLEGRPLSLSREAKIDLHIAVPTKLADKAPKQVGFFDFDRLVGRWIEVGIFQFVPQTLTYNGSVTSFGGAHNLDDPQDTTCVRVQVINPYDSSGVSGAFVTANGSQYSSSGTTDVNGFVCLLVQRNATFTVSAQGSIGNSNYGTEFPPTFTSPNISSGANDCADPTKCPFVGTVPIDFITGIGGFQILRRLEL